MQVTHQRLLERDSPSRSQADNREWAWFNSLKTCISDLHLMWYLAIIQLSSVTTLIFSVTPAARGFNHSIFSLHNRTRYSTIFTLLIVLLQGPSVLKTSYCKFTALSHLQCLYMVCLLPLSVCWSTEQRPPVQTAITLTSPETSAPA